MKFGETGLPSAVLSNVALSLAMLACLACDGEDARDLHDAAKRGDLNSVRVLLESGVGVNARSREFNLFDERGMFSECTAIVCAANSGEIEVVTYLLERGADINARGWRERTPLIMSAGNSTPEITGALLAAGADVSLRDDDERTALENSMLAGGVHVALLLFEATKELSDAHSIVKGTLDRAKWASEFNNNPHVHTYKAVFQSWLNELEGQFDPALHVAARRSAHAEHPKAALQAVLKGMPSIDERDGFGWTALMWAAGVLGADDSMAVLLAAGADPNAASPDGWTALMAAAEAGETRRVMTLLAAGSDPNRTERIGGHTALHLAVHGYSDPALIKALVESGGDVRIQNKSGASAMDLGRYRAWNADGQAMLEVLEQAFEDHPIEAQVIVLAKNKNLRAKISNRMRIRSIKASSDGNGQTPSFSIGTSLLPIDVAFDVFVRINGEEFFVRTWCEKMGTSNAAEASCSLAFPFEFEQMDVMMRPNQTLAADCLESLRIWGEELAFEGLGVGR